MSDKIHQDIDNKYLYFDQKNEKHLEEDIPDILICECNGVGVKDIKSLFQNESDFDLKIVKSKLKLGSGCGSCLKNINEWIHIFKKTQKEHE